MSVGLEHAWELFDVILCTFNDVKRQHRVMEYLLVRRTEHHLSSFKCGFLNIFSRQNLLRSLSRLLFLLQLKKYGAKKCQKNHIPFDF